MILVILQERPQSVWNKRFDQLRSVSLVLSFHWSRRKCGKVFSFIVMMDDSFQDVSIRSFEVYQDGSIEKLESRNENKKMEKEKKKKKKKSKQPTFADEEYLESTFQTSTLQANHQLGKSSRIVDKEIFASGSIWREPDTASSSVLIFQDEKMQVQGPPVANSRVSLDSDWNSSINLSVVSDELSSKLTNELTNVASEYHKETNTTLMLLVGYLVSMGTDLHTSENLAMSFMTQEGMLDKIQGHTSLVQKSQSRDSNRSSQGLHKIPLKQSYLASPYLRESATNDLFPADEETSQDAGLVNQPVAQATEVLDCEIEMPIVYAETSKIGFKDLVKERPIKFALMVGILGLFLLVGGIVAAIVYKTKTVGPDLVETNLPSMSPSNSPTMIQDDILLAAIQLSGEEPLLKSSSPQFRAVAWMSNFDTSSVYDIREAFAQRYAMVVLFYSFAGEEWINKENWLNPLLHECDWSAGISCSDKAAGGRLVTGLDATRNNLQGSIPPEIDLLPALQTLHLPNNKIRGTIPSTLGRMGSLSTLDCSYNEIEGSIPSSIGSATNLLSIDFSQNRLHGTLPQEIFSLTNLQPVTLPSNFLTGSLPEALQDSQALVTLDLRNNLFTGVFPLNLDSISALARIYLDYNQLTGKIPYLTAELAQMEVISIGHNSFTGNLELSPDFDLANIANLISDFRLKYVEASYNMLSGPISVIFGFLPTMRFFDVSGNNFTGSFPSAVG